jgi:DNA-binding CsgD family transcriptional regulator
MRRALGTTTNRFQRARLLPAGIEVLLAMGMLEEARTTCRELQELAEVLAADVLRAASAQATGAVAIGGDEAGAAIAPLRHAFELWTQLGAPYDAARTRVLIALACRALGDEDTALLEFAAARATFRELSARADLERVDRLAAPGAPDEGRLSPRELEVLRLIALGDTNRSIASKLGVSERTVDRHVSNILTKLGVPSRAAATAFAYEHQLL